MAKTGWTLEYINGLPENHLLFVYHWLHKTENDQWNRLGKHLGTLWDRRTLERLNSSREEGIKKDTIFVPLSLIMNPELPAALLGKRGKNTPKHSSVADLPEGDGLRTGMPLPKDSEVVNMANLDKNEFFGLIANAGLAKINK